MLTHPNRLRTTVLAGAALVALGLTGCTNGNPDVAGDDTPSAAATAPSTEGGASSSSPTPTADSVQANAEVLEWAEQTLDYDEGEGMIAGGQGRFPTASSNTDTFTSQQAGSFTVNAVCRGGGSVTFVVSSLEQEVARQDVTCDETVVPISVTTTGEGLTIETSTKTDGTDWAYALRTAA